MPPTRSVSEALLRSYGRSMGLAPRVVVGGNAAGSLGAVGDDRPVTRGIPPVHAQRADRHTHQARDRARDPFRGTGYAPAEQLAVHPSRLSQVPQLFTTVTPPDVVCVHTSTPSAGMVSLGVEVNILPAAIEAALARGALVLAQLNPAMPYTYGDAEIPLPSIDATLWVERPIADTGNDGKRTGPPQTAALSRLGRVVSDRVADGSVLQLGIGQVPDAVLPGLLARRDLGIWSEMISDGVMSLDQAGALSADKSIVASFVMGSSQLYKWADRNERLRLLRTETTNDPALIARNSAMVSVNTALQMDLFGQANACRIRRRIHSGFGGQIDFIEGALHAPGGQALMALQSWHPKADTSTIIPLIDEPVTTFQHTRRSVRSCGRRRGHWGLPSQP